MSKAEQRSITSKHPETDATAKFFWLFLIVTWIACLIYMYSNLMRGWVPHDEGALAQAAERVLQGELSHRDFDDIYTGGLALLNAAGFRALGTNLASMRWVMFLFFVGWVPAIYYVASRFVSPLASSAVTSLAVAWSVPNYAAAMPSWYNLFFAVFGAAALLRGLESNATRYLIIAGICGGLSCLVKITGMYYVAAVLLFFVFREQSLAIDTPADAAPRRLRFYTVTMVAGLLSFLLVILKTIDGTLDMRRFFQFVLPSLVLVTLLFRREARIEQRSDRKRFTVLLKMFLPFLAGILIPITAFLVPYIMTHSVQAMIHGVFVSPWKRLENATVAYRQLHPFGILVLLTLLALLYSPPKIDGPGRWWARMVFLIFLASSIILSSVSFTTYQVVWSMGILLIPITVLAGSVLLWKGLQVRITSLRQQQVFMLLSFVGVCSLIQFPFSAPIYFCYVAPLLALAICAVIASQKRQSPFIHGSLLVFYVAFAVLYTTPGFIYKLGVAADSDKQTFSLELPRAKDLRVSRETATEYQILIPLIQRHAKNRYVYAAPDCPEVYFLSGLRNPTRIIFDFINEHAGRSEEVIKEIVAHDINEVVLLTKPDFSPPISPDLKQQINLFFPKWVKIGRFQVRWKE